MSTALRLVVEPTGCTFCLSWPNRHREIKQFYVNDGRPLRDIGDQRKNASL